MDTSSVPRASARRASFTFKAFPFWPRSGLRGSELCEPHEDLGAVQLTSVLDRRRRETRGSLPHDEPRELELPIRFLGRRDGDCPAERTVGEPWRRVG